MRNKNMENNSIHGKLMEMVGNTWVSGESEEMQELVDCCMNGLEVLKTMNIELVLKQNCNINDVAVDIPDDLQEDQEEFSNCHTLTNEAEDRERIYQFFQLMYANYMSF